MCCLVYVCSSVCCLWDWLPEECHRIAESALRPLIFGCVVVGCHGFVVTGLVLPACLMKGVVVDSPLFNRDLLEMHLAWTGFGQISMGSTAWNEISMDSIDGTCPGYVPVRVLSVLLARMYACRYLEFVLRGRSDRKIGCACCLG